MSEEQSIDSRSRRLKEVIKKLGAKPAIEKVKKLLDRAYGTAKSRPLYTAPESHFTSIGCAPEDAPAYQQEAARVLTDLYHAAHSNTSRRQIKGLALQFALDARKPVKGDIQEYQCIREGAGWTVRRCNDALTTLVQTQAPVRVVDWSPAVEILDCVFRSPRQYDRLTDMIEELLGQVPEEKSDVRDTAGPPPRIPVGIGDDVHAHFLKEATRASRERADSDGWFQAKALRRGEFSPRTRTNWLRAASSTENSFLESNNKDRNARRYRVRRPKSP